MTGTLGASLSEGALDQLLSAVRDQLVDGQVESLLALERAARAVRTSAAQLVVAGERPAADVARLLAELQSAAVLLGAAANSAVTTLAGALDSAVSAALQRIAQDAADAVDHVQQQAGTAERTLADAVRQTAVDLSGHVEGTLSAVTAEADRAAQTLRLSLAAGADQVEQAAQRAQDAERHLADAVRQTTADLSGHIDGTLSSVTAVGDRAAETLRLSLTAGADHVEQAAQRAQTAERSLADAVRQAAADLSGHVAGTLSAVTTEVDRAAETLRLVHREGVERAARQAASAGDDVRLAGTEVIGSIREAGQAVIAEITTQAGLAIAALDRLEKRDVRREDRVHTRVEALLARVEDSLSGVGTGLAAAADRLVASDANRESRRADEFARVLEQVLGQTGMRGRKVRDRTLRGLRSLAAEAEGIGPNDDAVEGIAAAPTEVAMPAAAAKPASVRTPRAARKVPAEASPPELEAAPRTRAARPAPKAAKKAAPSRTKASTKTAPAKQENHDQG